MEHFAGYGFNKSHSTAYALLAYQTAYLKANYPWHFAAALLTIEAQNTDKLALYLGECRERGIPVLPPDINESQLRFTVEPERGVRFGLTAIKNVGEGAIESLLEVRAKQGRIRSLHALCEDLDLRLVEQTRVREPGQGRRLRLAGGVRSGTGRLPSRRCGRAFSPRLTPPATTARGPARSQRRAGAAVRRVRRRSRPQRLSTGSSRCQRPAVDGDRTAGLRKGDARPVLERPSGRSVRGRAEGLRRTRPANSPRHSQRRRATTAGVRGGPKPIEPDTSVGGIVAACRPLKTRKGDRMAVFTLEDAHGGVEVIAFPGGVPARRAR